MNLDTRKIFRVAIPSLIVAVVLVYGGYRSKDFLRGPILSVTYPANSATVSSPLLEIHGFAKNAKILTVNNDPFFIDEKGNFNKKLLLHDGYNIITIRAEDRYKRKVTKQLEIILKP